jgi:hypothetical protein
MSFEGAFEQRLNELLDEGGRIIAGVPRDSDGFPYYWVEDEHIPKCQSWISSTVNLIRLVDRAGGAFSAECDRLLRDKEYGTSIPSRLIRKLHGVLSATRDEWQRGLLRRISYIVVAEAFDDFLDHASYYHKGNKKLEASVLASAVLEDTVKKIARKHETEAKGMSLEPLVDELTKQDVFTPVKAKRVRGFAGVRNHALHAEWEEFDIRDVGELINGTRELIETFL